MKIHLCWILALFILAVSAQDAQIRVLNSSPDSPALDIFLNDTVKFSNVVYQQCTDYIAIPSDLYVIRVTPSDNHDKTLYSGTVGFSAGFPYTALGFGLVYAENYTTSPFGMTVVADMNDAPKTSAKTRIRFVHASPGTKPITVKADNEEWFSSVAYEHFSSYVEVDSNKPYMLQFYEPGNNNPIFTVPNCIPGGGRVHTVVLSGIIGSVGKQKLTVNSYIDATYEYFSFRVSNAISFSSIQFFLGSERIFDNIDSKEITGSITRPAGNYQVTVKSIDSKYSIKQDFTLNPNQLITFVAIGKDNTTSMHVMALEDDNSAPSSQHYARVRFIHAASDAPNLNIRVDRGSEWFNDLAYKQSTEYKEVPCGDYRIQVFSVHNANAPLISLSRQTLDCGKVYTFFIEGLLAKKKLSLVLSEDITYQYLTLSVAHLSPDASNFDIYVDTNLPKDSKPENLAFKDVSYKSVTDYKTFVIASDSNITRPATYVGAVTVTVTEAGNADKVIFTITEGFAADSVNTLAIYGLATTSDNHFKLQYLVMGDDNSAPSNASVSRVRFLHAAPGVVNLDVRANDVPLFDSMVYGNAGDFLEIPSRVYERLSFFPAGNLVDPVLVVDNVEFKGGSVYTLYAVGQKNNEDKPLDAMNRAHAAYDYITLSVAHASPDTAPLDIIVDKTKLFSGIAFTTETSAVPCLAGTHWIDVKPTGNDNAGLLISEKVDLEANKFHTLMITGCSKSADPPIDLFVVDNNWSAPSDEIMAKVRFVHVIPQLGPIDVYLNNTLLSSKLSYRQASEYLEVDGNLLYDVAGYFPDSDQTRPVFTRLFHFQGSHIYTLFGEGYYKTPKDNKVQIIPRVDYSPPPAAYLRFLHASPDMTDVDILINGQAQIFSLKYTEATDYIAVLPGAYSFQVVPAGKLSPVYVELSGEPLVSGSYHTLLIMGMVKDSNGAQFMDLLDDVTLDKGEHVKLRFIHTSPDAPAINVRLNGVETFKNLSYQDVSDYILAKQNRYTLEVYVAHMNPRFHGMPIRASHIFKDDYDWNEGAGVYTVVAEGLLYDTKEPGFRVYSYKDAGTTPPNPPSPTDNGDKHKEHKKLSKGGVAAIITVACICAIGLVIGLAYVVRKHRRAGYETIQ